MNKGCPGDDVLEGWPKRSQSADVAVCQSVSVMFALRDGRFCGSSVLVEFAAA